MKRPVTKRALGKHGPSVSSIALGAMGMSNFHGNADRIESIAALHAGIRTSI